MTPDGIMTSMAGPVEGSQGDWKLWGESGVEEKLRLLFGAENFSSPLYLYGDAAYYSRYGIIGAYRAYPGAPLTAEQKQFYTKMSEMRICIENGFGLISQLWQFNSFKYGFRYGSSPVAAFYLISVFLTNVFTCLRGNLISRRFDFPPPSLAMYLASE